jgi:AraC-like DNA-binding protein
MSSDRPTRGRRLSVGRVILAVMYRERPSRLPGAVVWHSRPDTTTRVLPDGCMDLLWSGDELLVAGPDTTAYLAGPSPYTGLRFAPGTAPALIGVPAHELRNRRVRLADLWPASRVRRLTALVERVGADTARVDRAGGALEEIALSLDPAPDPFLAELVRRLRAGEPVATIAADSGLSERQLHRRSLTAFGYGPKLLARILRLQRALDLARHGTPYATVAATAGYADQAHLSRDAKSLTGVPLGTLVP